MTRILNLILLAFISSVMASVLSPTVRAQASTPLLEQDLRLARIADAMLVSNARLCRETMPVPGIVLHSADQYGEEAEPLFANGPVAIAQVIPGSAADRAGLEAGDAVLAINGTWIDTLFPEGDGNLREAAFFLLADVASEDSVSLELQRAHERTTVVVDAPRGCRSLVEILVAEGPNARSDGRVIQLQFDFARTLSDEQVAALLAHELAHTVLEHRRRKVEAGIDNASLFRQLGRNQRVNRQAEVEADRLSVHLLANAGYDPLIAARFWRSPEGIEAGGGALPSFIYPTQEARADLIEKEVARYLPLRRGPTWPGHLVDLRDRSFAAD